MKVTTANGKLQVTLNRAEWKQMGDKMGWLKKEAKEAFPGAAPQFGKKKKDDEEKEGCDVVVKDEKEEKEGCEASKKR